MTSDSASSRPLSSQISAKMVSSGGDYDVEVSVKDATSNSLCTETQEWNDAEKSLYSILNAQMYLQFR
ncbi:hypothetical protein C453_19425 [Haloferax elongans ATCC BAA-1513]|uniref:Uncharacterized protein n=1 Tax=Haloferax elongans ATCC BAA-1513 TaxID=1230453 RepID=M0H962_HALEO|nr:hypothetical protein C453_19425 [Haloferax elongans ATCC BAA-1513]